jgi:peptidoglycan hydrolase-like protein with peptidoglycan-binding domain
MPDWIPDLTGGEGQIAQSVSSRIIDDAPAPKHVSTPDIVTDTPPIPTIAPVPAAPTREEVLAIQNDLEELGYDPGLVDGIAGSQTREAIKAYQKDLGWVVDGQITQELAVSLGDAPRPETPLTPDVAVAPELSPETVPEPESVPAIEPEIEVAVKPEIETAVEPETAPEIEPEIEIAVVPEIAPEIEPEIEVAVEPEIAPEIEPEIEVVVEPEIEPEVETAALPVIAPRVQVPVKKVHVDNADTPPFYDAGDAYIWSNGRVETVVRVAGNKLFWRVDNGVRFTADRNFLVPPSSWTGPAGTGEADARLDVRTFWPLAVDSPFAFKVVDNGQPQAWQCRISGTEHVTVPAGQFDVVALACDRDRAPPGEWVRRIWHYAPEVRHYVARIDIMPDGSQRSKELVGIRPGTEDWPPAVRAGLDRAIQDALGGMRDGERSLWSSTVVKEDFVILPSATRDTADGRHCRTFELTARSASGSRNYPALACRSDDGKKWQIPDSNRKRPKNDSFLTSAS